jgi:hypothetical protein
MPANRQSEEHISLRGGCQQLEKILPISLEVIPVEIQAEQV